MIILFMKKTLLLILISSLSFAQDWNFVGYYDGDARHHPITFANDRYGYVIAGQNFKGTDLDDVFRYDSQENLWVQLSDFPGGPRGYSYGVSDGVYAYMGFGSNSSGYPNDWWRYDLENDTWEELANFPSNGRDHPAMILCDNKIFVGLGSSDVGNLGDWWEYDIITNNWDQKADFNFGDRHHPFYFSINGVPFVGFGHGNSVSDNLVIYNDFYKYDINMNNWIQLSNFPSEGRVAGTQFSFNGKGYVLSGDGDDHGPLDSGELWEYNPNSDTWTQLTSHPGGARWAPGSFVIGCNVFLTSGFDAESNTYYNDLVSFKLSDECGCDDELAFNYDNNVLINDNSCCYIAGCTEPNSINYNDSACFNDNSCIPIVLGCNNLYASNYDSLANMSSSFSGPDPIDLGPGGYHYNDSWDMVFNCSQNVNLKSLDLYAESPFTTLIEILDLNNNQIFSSTIFLETGLNQVELNFLILEGDNYKLGINGLNEGLYRNSSVSSSIFPINLLNIIEITSNTTDSPLDYFYYFYNWQLEIECEETGGCIDLFACNYDEFAVFDDGSCFYPEEFYNCQGNCVNDIDNDLVCDEIDNCPEDFNPNQEDFNLDNVGDACDNILLNENSLNRIPVISFDHLGRCVDHNSHQNILIYIYDDGSFKKYFK
tara:strand:+ start:326 stop:2287 length:1962 start_codon:yes stop_codon:yes gene_type:complete